MINIEKNFSLINNLSLWENSLQLSVPATCLSLGLYSDLHAGESPPPNQCLDTCLNLSTWHLALHNLLLLLVDIVDGHLSLLKCKPHEGMDLDAFAYWHSQYIQ